MSEPAATIAKELDPARRRVLGIEVAVVVGIAVLPDIANAILVLCHPAPASDIVWQSTGTVDRSMRVSLAVLFIMWRSGDRWREFGIVPVRWVRDAALGAFLYFLGLAVYWVSFASGGASPFGFRAVPASEHAFAAPENTVGWILMSVVAVTNGFTEELVMRGFLIPRMKRVWGSTLAAVVFSTVAGSAYHIYQGGWGVYNAAVCSVLSGIIFAATRRLWPVVFAHMLGDIMPFVLN